MNPPPLAPIPCLHVIATIAIINPLTTPTQRDNNRRWRKSIRDKQNYDHLCYMGDKCIYYLLICIYIYLQG